MATGYEIPSLKQDIEILARWYAALGPQSLERFMFPCGEHKLEMLVVQVVRDQDAKQQKWAKAGISYRIIVQHPDSAKAPPVCTYIRRSDESVTLELLCVEPLKGADVEQHMNYFRNTFRYGADKTDDVAVRLRDVASTLKPCAIPQRRAAASPGTATGLRYA